MEKKINTKLISKVLRMLIVVVYILVLTFLLFLETLARYYGTGYSVSTLIYWFFLVGLVGLIANYKLKSTISFAIGLFFTAASIFLTVFGFRDISEIIMRVAYVFIIVGTVHSLFELFKRGKVNL